MYFNIFSVVCLFSSYICVQNNALFIKRYVPLVSVWCEYMALFIQRYVRLVSWVRCRWYVRVLAVRGFYDRRCYPDVAMKSRPVHTRSMYSEHPLIQNTLRTGECSIKSVWGLQLLMLLYVKTVRIWYTRSRNCIESRRAKFRHWHIRLPNRTFDICEFDITSTYHRYAC